MDVQKNRFGFLTFLDLGKINKSEADSLLSTSKECVAHLLSFGRVGLGVGFEVRKLLTVVVIHPFTEVVADVEPSAERSNNQSGETSFIHHLCVSFVRA